MMTTKKASWMVVMVFLWLIIVASAVFGQGQGTALRANNGTGTNLTAINGLAVGASPSDPNLWTLTNSAGLFQFEFGLVEPLVLFPPAAELASSFASNVFIGTIYSAATPPLPDIFAANNGNPGFQSTYSLAQPSWDMFHAQDINNITFPFDEYVVQNPNTADVTTNETFYLGFNTLATGGPVNTNFAAYHIKWHGNEAIIDTNHLGIFVLESIFPDTTSINPLQIQVGIRPGDPEYKLARFFYQLHAWSMAWDKKPTTNLFNFNPSDNNMNLTWSAFGSLIWNDSTDAQNLIQLGGLGNLMDFTGTANGSRLQLFTGVPSPTFLLQNNARMISPGIACFGTNNIITGGTNQHVIATASSAFAHVVATNGNTYLGSNSLFVLQGSTGNFLQGCTNASPPWAWLGTNGVMLWKSNGWQFFKSLGSNDGSTVVTVPSGL